MQNCRFELNCGHQCMGVAGDDKNCLPCLKVECRKGNQMTEQDECGICMEVLGAAPCIKVCKRHVFHAECIAQLIHQGEPTAKMAFNFLNCPTCKQEMTIDRNIPVIGEMFEFHMQRKMRVMEMAVKEAKVAGLEKDQRLCDPFDPFYNNLGGLAMALCTFYECHNCKDPYFGGMVTCAEAINLNEQGEGKREHMLCRGCRNKALGFGVAFCEVEGHGDAYIDYKCRFCCEVAVFFCFGGTPFCQGCHNKLERGELDLEQDPREAKCTKKDKTGRCHLGIEDHAAAAEQPIVALGCGLCRSKKLAMMT